MSGASFIKARYVWGWYFNLFGAIIKFAMFITSPKAILYYDVNRPINILTLSAPSYPKLHIAAAPSNLSIVANFN